MTGPVPARFALLLAAVVVRAVAAEPTSTQPLEESKKALRELQQRQATRDAAASTSKLGEALPKLQAPSAEPMELPSPASARNAQGKQSAPKKNWLIDGMGKKDAQGATAEDDDAVDPASPDFLVESYRRGQAKKDRLAAEESRQRTKPSEEAKPANPLEGYMKNWLAGSPVDRSVFESIDHGARLRGVDLGSSSDKKLFEGTPVTPQSEIRSGGRVARQLFTRIPTWRDWSPLRRVLPRIRMYLAAGEVVPLNLNPRWSLCPRLRRPKFPSKPWRNQRRNRLFPSGMKTRSISLSLNAFRAWFFRGAAV